MCIRLVSEGRRDQVTGRLRSGTGVHGGKGQSRASPEGFTMGDQGMALN
jgi:hypothetical protein